METVFYLEEFAMLKAEALFTLGTYRHETFNL